MEKDNIIYFNIYKKYLAYGMSFLGFNFKKNVDYNGKIVYTFQKTQRFKRQIWELSKGLDL